MVINYYKHFHYIFIYRTNFIALFIIGTEIKNEPLDEFNFQVIPVENSLKDLTKSGTRKNLTVEVSSEFQDYIDMNPDFQDFRTESENSR